MQAQKCDNHSDSSGVQYQGEVKRLLDRVGEATRDRSEMVSSYTLASMQWNYTQCEYQAMRCIIRESVDSLCRDDAVLYMYIDVRI